MRLRASAKVNSNDADLEAAIRRMKVNFGAFGAPMAEVAASLSGRMAKVEAASRHAERQLSGSVAAAVEAIEAANQGYHDSNIKPYAMNAEAAYKLAQDASSSAGKALECAERAEGQAEKAQESAKSALSSLEDARKEIAKARAESEANTTTIMTGLQANDASMERLREDMGTSLAEDKLTARTAKLLAKMFSGRVPVKGTNGSLRFEQMSGSEAFQAVLSAIESFSMGTMLQLEAYKRAVEQAAELRADYHSLLSGAENEQMSRDRARISDLTDEVKRLEADKAKAEQMAAAAEARAAEAEAHRSQVAELKGKVEELDKNWSMAPKAPSEPAESGLAQRIDALEQRLDEGLAAIRRELNENFANFLTAMVALGGIPGEAMELLAGKDNKDGE